MREFWTQHHVERKIVVFFLGVAILTLTGPFGTYEFSLVKRVVFWLAIFAGVGFFMHICVTTALRSLRLWSLPQVLRIMLGVALAALPGTAVVAVVEGLFRPPLMDESSLMFVYVQVAAIGLIVSLIEYPNWFGTPEEAETERRPRSRFHKRLPPELGDDIISISMRDHYAEVTTTNGVHMVLIRFSDAMAELEGWPGHQTHRSHWVASDHIVDTRKENGKKVAVLSDGRSLPVSGSHAKSIDEAVRSITAR